MSPRGSSKFNNKAVIKTECDRRRALLNIKNEQKFELKENRKKIFSIASKENNKTDTNDPSNVIILAFFNYGNKFRYYPANALSHLPISLSTQILSFIFLMYTELTCYIPAIFPITNRTINKISRVIAIKPFFDNLHFAALNLQVTYVPNLHEPKFKRCNHYDPRNFAIPSLEWLILTFLHRETGFKHISSLNKFKLDYSGRETLYMSIPKSQYPAVLLKDLLLLNKSCQYHDNSIVNNTGVNLNDHHFILIKNSKLYSVLQNETQCHPEVLNRIFTKMEAKTTFRQHITKYTNYSNMDIDLMLNQGFRVIENYDNPYPSYMCLQL